MKHYEQNSMRTECFISFIATAVALLVLLSSAYPTSAAVPYQDQCIEATETHLPVCVWHDTGHNPKGVVLLLHGIFERAHSLEPLAQELVSNGFLVYGLDERGHGWWHFNQQKGAPGYKCDFRLTVNDVDKLLHVLKKKHPDTPIFMIGESVGAAIVWRAAVDSPEAVDGIVAAATGTKTGHAGMRWIIADFLRTCFHWDHPINIVRYQLRFSTDDVPSLEENLKDPEQRKTLTLSEIVGTLRFLHKNIKFARRLDPHIAVLVIQGSNDRVLSPKSAREVFDAANTSDKRLVIVPGCGHVILGVNRPKPLVNEAITTFLNEVALRHRASTATSDVSREAEALLPARTIGSSSQQ